MGKSQEQYQILVKTRNPEGELRIGPVLNVKSVLEDQCAIINKAVAEGKEKDWHDARVIEIQRVIN